MEVKGEFPKADPLQLKFRYQAAPRSGGNIIEVKYHTSYNWYPLHTKSRGDVEKTINTSLPKRIKDALGQSVTESINKTNAVLQDLKKQEKTQRNEL